MTVTPRTGSPRELVHRLTQRHATINSCGTARALDLLDHVDTPGSWASTAATMATARPVLVVGPAHLGPAHLGRREVDAAVHELLMVLWTPVRTTRDDIARGRRVRTRLPSVWAAWHAGTLTAAAAARIDAAGRRFTRPCSVILLDDAAVGAAMHKTTAQLTDWL